MWLFYTILVGCGPYRDHTQKSRDHMEELVDRNRDGHAARHAFCPNSLGINVPRSATGRSGNIGSRAWNEGANPMTALEATSSHIGRQWNKARVCRDHEACLLPCVCILQAESILHAINSSPWDLSKMCLRVTVYPAQVENNVTTNKPPNKERLSTSPRWAMWRHSRLASWIILDAILTMGATVRPHQCSSTAQWVCGCLCLFRTNGCLCLVYVVYVVWEGVKLLSGSNGHEQKLAATCHALKAVLKHSRMTWAKL